MVIVASGVQGMCICLRRLSEWPSISQLIDSTALDKSSSWMLANFEGRFVKYFGCSFILRFAYVFFSFFR